MESLNGKKGFSNFELSCCLDSMMNEYEQQLHMGDMEKGRSYKNEIDSEDFIATIQNKYENAENNSDENIKDRIEILSALKEYIDLKDEDVLGKRTGETSNNVRYSILDVLELDRKRIARDLHDSSVQLLTMLVHKAELCEKLIDIDTIRTKMELHMMGDFLKDAISELRQTIFDLRPMTMDDLGLMDSIERYIQMLIQSSEIQFRITVANGQNDYIEKILKPVEKLSVYRILQECCSNIIKHSKATKSLISLKLKNGFLYLQVDDNGVGFKDKQRVLRVNEMSQAMSNREDDCLEVLSSMLYDREDFTGYGLSMLFERVYLLNGTLNIQTGENGTSISIQIPVETNEEGVYETN